MVTAILVDKRIELGEKLLRKLDDASFPTDAALWYYREESESWRLRIASPLVDSKGPRAAYSRIQAVLRATSMWDKGIPLDEISAVGTKDKMVKALKGRFGGSDYAIRREMLRFPADGMYIDGVYIYRL